MRHVFLSFHYKNDCWRVQQIRNMGVIESQRLFHANEWEDVKRKGDSAIQRWIDSNLHDCSCLIVLIGSQTANRKWVHYEIQQAIKQGKKLLGIYIHHLKNENGNKDEKGANPFDYIQADTRGILVTSPSPSNPYKDIKDNLECWIEKARPLRDNNPMTRF
ncbi:TIR domain-containing protein [Helicobacter cetorum]|nr:TIR domain-containing protein [Helicobacter cetorum]